MAGRTLDGGGKPRGGRVDLWGGTHYPKVRQAAFVCQEKLEGWEASFNGQDVGGGADKAVGCPSLDLVPEGGELPHHVDGGQENVRAVAKHREEEGGGQSVA